MVKQAVDGVLQNLATITFVPLQICLSRTLCKVQFWPKLWGQVYQGNLPCYKGLPPLIILRSCSYLSGVMKTPLSTADDVNTVNKKLEVCR